MPGPLGLDSHSAQDSYVASRTPAPNINPQPPPKRRAYEYRGRDRFMRQDALSSVEYIVSYNPVQGIEPSTTKVAASTNV